MSGMNRAIAELKRLMGDPASVREPRLEMLQPIHPPCPAGSKWDGKMGQCKPTSGKKGKPTPQPDGKPASDKRTLTGGESLGEARDQEIRKVAAALWDLHRGLMGWRNFEHVVKGVAELDQDNPGSLKSLHKAIALLLQHFPP